MCPAIALILFNRPDTTEQVMQQIAKARPSRLFLIADGPRPDRADDVARCAAARRAAENLVNWDCELVRIYADKNQGCGWGPANGISTVFQYVEEVIILEDDCVPHPSYFRFCAELLERYRQDERVVQISGNFHHYGRYSGTESYFFSRHNICAGSFATWRRAWQNYDAAVRLWPRLRDTPWLRYHTGDARAEKNWRAFFDISHAVAGGPEMHNWDYQWTFACWAQSGLSIVSKVGLLSNIGFRPDGTHTKAPSRWANLPLSEMEFPLVHPPFVVPDAVADMTFLDAMFAVPPKPSLLQRVRVTVSSLVPAPLRRMVKGLWSRRGKSPGMSHPSAAGKGSA